MIKIVRLKSGEELIADVSENMEGTEFYLNKACIILPTGESGQIGLYKFMPYAKTEKITVRQTDTYFVVEPEKDLSDYYTSITGESNIIQAPTKEIIL